MIVSLMKKKFVDEYHWIEEDEMLDLIAIAQSTPGAIAVNGAIVVGYKLAGISGALVAIIATILPPFLILTVLSFLYERFRSNLLLSQLLAGMQAGVGAVIASVVWSRPPHSSRCPAALLREAACRPTLRHRRRRDWFARRLLRHRRGRWDF